MTDSIRLAKRVAELRHCSRREAELIITGGLVRVDGVVVEEPQFRVSDPRIEIDPRADPGQAEPVTLLGHQVSGPDLGDRPVPPLPDAATLCAEDVSGIRPLKKHFARLIGCMPLEACASGLVVFSQDWRVVRKLTEDAATLEHEVIVEIAGELAASGLGRLNQGIAFRGRVPASIKVSRQSETRLRIALKGLRPGQIQHMCESVGLKVLSMKRIRLGRIPLGKLPPGQWRYLHAGERF